MASGWLYLDVSLVSTSYLPELTVSGRHRRGLKESGQGRSCQRCLDRVLLVYMFRMELCFVRSTWNMPSGKWLFNRYLGMDSPGADGPETLQSFSTCLLRDLEIYTEVLKSGLIMCNTGTLREINFQTILKYVRLLAEYWPYWSYKFFVLCAIAFTEFIIGQHRIRLFYTLSAQLEWRPPLTVTVEEVVFIWKVLFLVNQLLPTALPVIVNLPSFDFIRHRLHERIHQSYFVFII